MALRLTRRRFTVAEYHVMAQAGILGEDDQVELIDGEILQMAPIGRRHASCVARVSHLFEQATRGAVIVWSQNPIALGEHSEPQPDIALLRPRADFYASALPTPDDILLLIEVAESSLEYDRRVKLPLYARSGVPESWLVQLDRDQITVHRDPSPTGYQTVQTVRREERLTILALPDLELTADDLLG